MVDVAEYGMHETTASYDTGEKLSSFVQYTSFFDDDYEASFGSQREGGGAGVEGHRPVRRKTGELGSDGGKIRKKAKRGGSPPGQGLGNHLSAPAIPTVDVLPTADAAAGFKEPYASDSDSDGRGGADVVNDRIIRTMYPEARSGPFTCSSSTGTSSGTSQSGDRSSPKPLASLQEVLPKPPSPMGSSGGSGGTSAGAGSAGRKRGGPSYTALICSQGNMIASLILQICAAANTPDAAVFISNGNRGRLQFLKDTVEHLVSYVCNQREDIKVLEVYGVFLGVCHSRLEEVADMLRKISTGESTVTENFDIFELKLRSYLEELHALFPVEDGKPRDSPYRPGAGAAGGEGATLTASQAEGGRLLPTSVIQDEYARQIWESEFGPEVFYVTYDRFLLFLSHRGLVTEEQMPDSEMYHLYLRYFLNFPSDNVVSTYKWHQFVRLFGPPQQLATNFGTIVSGQGFLGLINRIRAYEILTLTPQPRSVLIRFSRTEPQFLAFSYRNSEGKINHQVNRDRKTGEPIPVDVFLRKRFPKYHLVNKRLDVRTILGCKRGSSLCEYASASAGYIL